MSSGVQEPVAARTANGGLAIWEAVLAERRLRLLAMVLWLIGLTVIAGTLLIWAGRGFPRAPISFARGPLGTSAVALTGLVYSTVAVFLTNRLPRNPIGWIFLTIGLGMALVMPVNLALSDSLRSFRPVPLSGLLMAWALTSVQLPASGALLVVVLLLFPSGRPSWRRFRLAAGVAILGCLLMTVGTLLEPDGLLWYPSLPNPTGAPSSLLPWLVAARVAGMVCLLLSGILAAAWLAMSYRAGDRHLRRQLGWVLVGAVAMVTTLGPLFAVRYAIGAPDAVGEHLVFIAAVGGCLFPITVAVAGLREHLFGIEGFVARTLVYVPLMAILAGLYTASVLLLQRLFMAFTGNSSDAAVVMATLLLAAALTPVRRSLEGLVERSTRARPAALTAGPAGDPALQVVLERLETLERRITELGASPEPRASGSTPHAPPATQPDASGRSVPESAASAASAIPAAVNPGAAVPATTNPAAAVPAAVNPRQPTRDDQPAPSETSLTSA